ncbi:hypothetical protein [Kamptonema formosum]|uniref:hypothetical protein n=1 Tax=Kamptonema formosum TaxID=331992 RepID=UPI0003499E39|nr:hypothetical protein [Oscillatoria sp. PCC 10802]
MFIEEINQKLNSLPTRRIKINPDTVLGSYVELAPERVKLEDAEKAIKDVLASSDFSGITTLLPDLYETLKIQLRQLPAVKVKHNPLAQYNQKATLALTEDYVEIAEVRALVEGVRSQLAAIESLLIDAYRMLLTLKEARLPEGLDSKSVEPAPPLKGTQKDVEIALEIRESFVEEIAQQKNSGTFPPKILSYIQAQSYQITSAAWWCKNQHRLPLAALSKVNQALDKELLSHWLPPS